MIRRLTSLAAASALAVAASAAAAAPASAAPVPTATQPYCITMAGALTCIGAVPSSTNYMQAPVKRIPERQAQRAYVRALAVKLIQQRIAARQAALAAR